jgi:hypothetical protein
MEGQRDARIGLNEAVFRELNERIENLAETFGIEDQQLDLVCECGDGTCTERITMTRNEYEDLRSDPTHFAVFPGHEQPGVERFVARRGTYDVVRKREGIPAAIAEQTDPRT